MAKTNFTFKSFNNCKKLADAYEKVLADKTAKLDDQEQAVLTQAIEIVHGMYRARVITGVESADAMKALMFMANRMIEANKTDFYEKTFDVINRYNSLLENLDNGMTSDVVIMNQ